MVNFDFTLYMIVLIEMIQHMSCAYIGAFVFLCMYMSVCVCPAGNNFKDLLIQYPMIAVFF